MSFAGGSSEQDVTIEVGKTWFQEPPDHGWQGWMVDLTLAWQLESLEMELVYYYWYKVLYMFLQAPSMCNTVSNALCLQGAGHGNSAENLPSWAYPAFSAENWLFLVVNCVVLFALPITKHQEETMVVAKTRPTPQVPDKEKLRDAQLPGIDLSGQKADVSKHIVKACEDFGFFKLINHGVAMDVIANMEEASYNFFSRP